MCTENHKSRISTSAQQEWLISIKYCVLDVIKENVYYFFVSNRIQSQPISLQSGVSAADRVPIYIYTCV